MIKCGDECLHDNEPGLTRSHVICAAQWLTSVSMHIIHVAPFHSEPHCFMSSPFSPFKSHFIIHACKSQNELFGMKNVVKWRKWSRHWWLNSKQFRDIYSPVLPHILLFLFIHVTKNKELLNYDILTLKWPWWPVKEAWDWIPAFSVLSQEPLLSGDTSPCEYILGWNPSCSRPLLLGCDAVHLIT